MVGWFMANLTECLPENVAGRYFRAALRTARSDRNGGSAEFFNSLLEHFQFK
jgi:hypothetical protein